MYLSLSCPEPSQQPECVSLPAGQPASKGSAHQREWGWGTLGAGEEGGGRRNRERCSTPREEGHPGRRAKVTPQQKSEVLVFKAMM